MLPSTAPPDLSSLRRLLDAAELSADPRLAHVYDAFEAVRPALPAAPAAVSDAELEALLADSTRHLFGADEVAVSEVVFRRVEGAPFVHGVFRAHDRAASFLFFEDRRRGIVAIDRGEGMIQLGALRRRRRALDA